MTQREKDLQQIIELQQRAIQFAEAGMMEEALESAVVSLGLQEEAVPEDLLLRGKLMQNTARILLLSGDLEQSEAISAEGVNMLHSLPDCPPAQLAEALLNLSSIQYGKENLDDAIASLSTAMQIWKEEEGPESNQVADCYNNLGRIREQQGQPLEGAKLHQRAYDIKHAIFGDHTESAFCLMNIGAALMGAGRLAEAHARLTEAVACCDRAGISDTDTGKACAENLRICAEYLAKQ